MAHAATPEVSRVEVSNITPASFAVSWISSVPATATLTLFAADCATPVSDSFLATEANDATGVIRVTVSGLTAATSYCYQTVTTAASGGETVTVPPQPAPVSTAAAVSRTRLQGGVRLPFANDLLDPLPDLSMPGSSSQAGTLILLDLADGMSLGPLSILAGTAPLTRYFNLNNLFDSSGGATINLTGGERLRITERQGKNGCSIERFRLAPPDGDLTRAAAMVGPANKRDLDINGTVNILDILRVAAGVGTYAGAPCYNGDLDMNIDQVIDVTDLQELEVNFDGTL